MNAKSWRQFWLELVLQRKRKRASKIEEDVNNIRQYMCDLASRSNDYDRKLSEERAIRLMRVVRFLRREGWQVERNPDGTFKITDAQASGI